MSRELADAARKLAETVLLATPCSDWERDEDVIKPVCCVDGLVDAANEVLDELHRAGVLPVRP